MIFLPVRNILIVCVNIAIKTAHVYPLFKPLSICNLVVKLLLDETYKSVFLIYKIKKNMKIF